MPSVFKERLFVWLSRFCPMRYCVVRHVGFLLGDSHGRAAGDTAAVPQTIDEIVGLLRRPSPWQREMGQVYADLDALGEQLAARKAELMNDRPSKVRRLASGDLRDPLSWGGSLRRSFCFRGLEQRLYCKPSLDVYLYLARNRHAGRLTRTLLGQTKTHIKDTG
jgi:hypothetical protein